VNGQVPARGGVLVYGGSFNPPHRGHAALLKAAIRKVHPERVLLVPAYHSPLKALPGTAAEQRLGLLKRFVAGSFTPQERRLIGIDTGELDSGRKIYTWRTLGRIHKCFKGRPLFLLLGSDCLADFDKWKRPDIVAALATLVVGMRPGYAISGKRPALKLPGVFPRIASSEIQRQILLDGEVPPAVPPVVAGAIKRKKLYGLDSHAKLRKLLEERRYNHSVSVARLCAALAARHGADPIEAARAGLLHDCAKSLSSAKMSGHAERRLSRSELTLFQRHARCLLHAAAGAELASKVFSVRDPDVLSAIERHALGCAHMSLLDKIVYVADIASEDRHFPGTAALRKQSFSNLDAALESAARIKLQALLQRGRWVAPQGLELWNALSDKNRCF